LDGDDNPGAVVVAVVTHDAVAFLEDITRTTVSERRRSLGNGRRTAAQIIIIVPKCRWFLLLLMVTEKFAENYDDESFLFCTVCFFGQ
jgi:hypothetical protein